MKKTRQEYIRDLQTVQDKVAIMGETARQALHKAMKSLMESDRKLAGEVMKADDAIDDMIIDIEDYCLLLIAKQQPIAHDLRVIATGFKISTDIERIGDHAYDIAKTAMSFDAAWEPEKLQKISSLGDYAEAMLEKAIEAYRRRDVVMADEVRKMDQGMDDLVTKTFYMLSGMVTEVAKRQKQITQLLFVSRFLERIGDHAVNIAEWIIYLETAERIHTQKHTKTSV